MLSLQVGGPQEPELYACVSRFETGTDEAPLFLDLGAGRSCIGAQACLQRHHHRRHAASRLCHPPPSNDRGRLERRVRFGRSRRSSAKFHYRGWCVRPGIRVDLHRPRNHLPLVEAKNPVRLILWLLSLHCPHSSCEGPRRRPHERLWRIHKDGPHHYQPPSCSLHSHFHISNRLSRQPRVVLEC